MKSRRPRYTSLHLLALFAIIFSFAAGVAPASAAPARSHTPDPTSVTLVGSLQSELGCGGDWDPTCAATHLTYDAGDTVWQGSWTLPAGPYEYKVALNDSWDENYGKNAQPGGANIPLNLAADAALKFYYSHETHWLTDNSTSVIATVPGNFQSEIGCPGDWDRAVSAPGSRTPMATASTFLRRPRFRPVPTKARSPLTKAGTSTTARAASRTARISRSRSMLPARVSPSRGTLPATY